MYACIKNLIYFQDLKCAGKSARYAARSTGMIVSRNCARDSVVRRMTKASVKKIMKILTTCAIFTMSCTQGMTATCG